MRRFFHFHRPMDGGLGTFSAWSTESRLLRLRIIPGFIQPGSAHRTLRCGFPRWRHQRRDVFRAEGEDFDSAIDRAVGKDDSIGTQRIPHHA